MEVCNARSERQNAIHGVPYHWTPVLLNYSGHNSHGVHDAETKSNKTYSAVSADLLISSGSPSFRTLGERRLYQLPLNVPSPFLTEYFMIPLLALLVVWSVFWKIIGLWSTARNNEKGWFILFVFISLAGILELYYLHSRNCWPFKHEQRR